MSQILLVLVLAAAVVALVRWVHMRRARGRAEARERPFPPEWRQVLERRIAAYGRLRDDERARLEDHVQVFLAEKSFEGLGGLEMTDEIRVTIAGQACLLLLNLDEADYYGRLRSILVYPSTVRPVYVERHAHGTLPPEDAPVLGQSWGHGAVVLAWDSVRRGTVDPGDGHNVVLHEFAHQLDQEDGEADGIPVMESGSALRAWARVMREHHAALREAVQDGKKTVLDEYGAKNPAEFFAVATEHFFEKPERLKRLRPELYDELAAYYRQDPASWPPAG